MTGIPCAHVFSTILYDEGNPKDYVHSYYKKDMYLLSYEPIIYSMPTDDQWVKMTYEVLEPPVVRTQPGRLKMLRIRLLDEPRNPYKLSRYGLRGQSKKCKMSGHNSRRCPRRKATAQRFAIMNAVDGAFVFEGEDATGPVIHDETDNVSAL